MLDPLSKTVISGIAGKATEKTIEKIPEFIGSILLRSRERITMYIGLHYVDPQLPDKTIETIRTMFKYICKDRYDEKNKLCIIDNENKYLIKIKFTTVSDNILGEEIYGLFNFMELEDNNEFEDLLSHLGISKEYLDYITDISIEITPLSKKPIKSLYTIARSIYDYVNTYMRSFLSAKITIVSDDEKILKKYLEKAGKLNLKIYKGNRKITLILKLSQVIDKEIYEKLAKRVLLF